jgi:cytochrome c5
MPHKLTGYLLAFMLALLVVGCGGGGDERASLQGEADKSVDIVARTGPILAVRVGETANLSDNNSFTSLSEPLSFHWSFVSRPDGSNALLQNTTSANPSFVADTRGTYRAQLVVSAGALTSQRAIQLVVATIPPEPVTGPVNHQGLSSNCVICHDDEISGISPKVGNHVAATNNCEACHTPLGFTIIPFVDHQEVFGNCSGCHNGVLAVGKSEFHVPTSLECDDCHNTTSFFALAADGSFDHTGISSGCAGCHNGTTAIGMTDTVTHQNSTGECELCHNTIDFADAYPDHTGPEVVGPGITCDSCHGVTATGQSNGHPVTSVDCGICHNIETFSLGGFFEHGVIDPVSQPCADCHNGNNSINAIGKTPTPPHPATTGDCGSCHNTQSFQPAFLDHNDPAVLAARCDSCHVADGSGTALGKSANHMPTTPGDDCGICHTPGNFGSGDFDHVGVVNNCVSCHDDVINTGKPPFHLPTVQDCVLCHTTTVFIPTIFDHVGITTNCASCHDGAHDGTGAIGRSLNHVPTAEDCFVCHTTDSFAGAIFNHVGIDPNDCASCHDTGIATPKKANHIAASDDCSVCHDSTFDFTSTTFLATIHLGITQGCEGCHNSLIFPTPTVPSLVKEADHLPTNQDCDVCHTVAGFDTSTFDHVGISGNCVSCHDGNYVGNVIVRGAPDDTIHQNTTADCVVCHNTDNFADAFVDHTGPEVIGRTCESCHNGAPLIGAPNDTIHQNTTEDCGICHVAGGTFAPAVFDHTGIVDNCASCHDGTAATGLSVGHIATGGNDCSVCHNTTAFAGAHFDHQGIQGNCASCHNGTTATGKHTNHVPTNQDCVDCHQTTGFKPATFDHVGIVDNCVSCHDGQLATGKTPTPPHPDTNQDCGVCHNPQGFVPATFDHTGIVDNCASCHDGNPITGLSPNHIPTALDCHFCHTTATFADGSWDHQGINGNCTSCHDGTIATGKGGNHFDTTQECNACHSTQNWAANDYTHLNNGDYPGDHRSNVGCIDCHQNNDENINYPTQTYAGTCAGCHANDYKTGPHKKSENPDIKYTVSELRDCAGACHVYTNANFNVIKKTRNNEHNTNDGDFD